MSDAKVSRRDFLKAASTALAATGFAALPAGLVGAQDEEITLELWGFASNRDEWMNDVIAEVWSELHPNVNINLSLTPGGDFWPKLQAVFVGGAGIPDIVDIADSTLGPYVRDEGSKPVVALNDHVADHVDNLSVQSALDPFTVNGSIYCLGNEVNPLMLYYSHEVADELGVDMESPATWAEFVAQAGPGAVAGGYNLVNQWLQHWVEFYFMYCQAGGQLFDEEGNPAILSDLAVEVMTWQREQIEAGIFADVCDAFWACYNDNQYLANTGAPWHQGFMKQNGEAQAGRWKMRTLPQWSEGGALSVPYGGTGMGITAASEHKEASWEFIRVCNLTDEGALLAFRRMNLFPAYTPVWDDDELRREDEYFSGQIVGDHIRKAADGMISFNRSPNWSLLIDAMQRNVAAPVYMQGADPREALQAAIDDYEFNL